MKFIGIFCFLWVEEVVGSNPVVPTNRNKPSQYFHADSFFTCHYVIILTYVLIRTKIRMWERGVGLEMVRAGKIFEGTWLQKDQ